MLKITLIIMYICSINGKLFFGIILLCTVLCSCGKSQNTTGGLLWEISGNGLKQPSYLFGTNHGMSGRFLDSISGIYEALHSVNQFAVEFDNSNPKKLDSIKPINVFLPVDTTYQDLLDKREIAVLDSILYIYFKVNSGKVKLNPNALMVNLQLEMIKRESQNWAKLNPFLLFVSRPYENMEYRLLSIAKNMSYPIIELDNEYELDRMGLRDMNILFSSDNLQAKAKEMVFSIMESLYDTLYFHVGRKAMEAYYQQSLELIENWDIYPKILKNKKAKSFHYAVVTKRNILWIDKILYAIHENPTFIMVGAAHLPGKKGIINLLSDEGYIVKSVK